MAKRDLDVILRAKDKTSKVFGGFRRALNKIKKVGAKVGGVLVRGFALIGTAAIAAAAALAVLAKRQADVIDGIAKTSSALGLETEALVALQHAAAITGASNKELEVGLKNLSRRISEAATGTGEGVDALRDLGLAAKELKSLSPDKQFAAIADAMNGLEDQSDKVRISMDLFGRSGVALINTMADGSEGLAAFRKEAEALGLTFNRDQAARVERANDAWTRFKAIFTGALRQFTIEMAPIATLILEKVSKFGPLFVSFGRTAALGLTEVALGANKLRAIPVIFGNLVEAAGIVVASIIERFKLIVPALKVIFFGATTGATQILADFAAQVAQFTGSDFFRGLHLGMKAALGPMRAEANGLADDLERRLETVNQTWAQTWQEISDNSLAAMGKIGATQKRLLDEITRLRSLMAEELKGGGDETDKVLQTLNTKGQAVASSLQGAFSTVFSGIESGAVRLQDVLKGVLRDLSRIVTQRAITSAVSSVPFLSSVSALGNVFNNGKLQAFASGGVLNSPAIFPMANGGVGLAGEAGPEAIMPLRRNSRGQLGVLSEGGGGGGVSVTINIAAMDGASVARVLAGNEAQKSIRSAILNARDTRARFR